MSNISEHHNVCVESADFICMPPACSADTTESVKHPPLSSGDITRSTLKHSSSVLHREDSISSKSSSNSLFPTFMKSFDSTTFSLNQDFFPRPEKSLVLFDIVLSTLKDLKKKYSSLTHPTAHSPGQVQGEMSKKVENRISLIQSLRDEYKCTLEEKEAELNKIKATIKSVILSKNVKEEIETLDCENYWSLCRDMCIIELKLEKCCGKLQFQIMELDFVSRVNLLDQYELSIKLNDVSKFKTKIKIEKNGHQVWDNTTFVLTPSVEDCLDVKFCELKTLNKQLVLLEKKVMFVNNLILSEPSIFTFWLTPVGTIKLKVIVQWNAILEDLELGKTLNQIQSKFQETDVVIRKRMTSSALKYSQNRLSVNFGHFFKSQNIDKTSPFGSMENIAEQVEEGKVENVNIRGVDIERESDKIKGRYHEDFLSQNIKSEKIEEGQDQAPPQVIIDTNFTDNEGVVKVFSEEVKMCDKNENSEEIIHSDYTKQELKYEEISKVEEENIVEEGDKIDSDKEELREDNKIRAGDSLEQNEENKVEIELSNVREEGENRGTHSEHMNEEEDISCKVLETGVLEDLVVKCENQQSVEEALSDSAENVAEGEEAAVDIDSAKIDNEAVEERVEAEDCVEDSAVSVLPVLRGSSPGDTPQVSSSEGDIKNSYSLDDHCQDVCGTVEHCSSDCPQSADRENTEEAVIKTDTEETLQEDTAEPSPGLRTSSVF